MEELKFFEFLDLFEDDTQEKICQQIIHYDATHVVLAENIDMCSSQFGKRTAMLVGPNNTYKTVEECEGKWLGDLPSVRQYFTKFAVVPNTFRSEAAKQHELPSVDSQVAGSE